MPVTIRLSRHGRTNRPFYHIVVADSRAPRDGRYIEKLGTYDPLHNPAKVDINFDKAVSWLMKGALPTDTCRTILSAEGIMYKKHLLVGVNKKAMTAEQAEQKFQTWMTNKESKKNTKVSAIQKKRDDVRRDRLNAKTKAKEAKAAAIAKKLAEASAAPAAAENTESAQ